MRYASTTVLPTQQPRTVNSDFFFVNKQNSKTRYYFQRCSLLLNDAENSPETAYWPQMVYKPHHTTQYKVQLHFSNNKTLKKFQCDMRKSEIDD